jgi:alkylated DNA repair protein alkB family protein 7
MHLSSWPEDQNPGLSFILARLQGLYPTSNIQTHILHLSSVGEILGHVDNVEASGTWILGISLGAARVLRMESTSNPEDSFEVLLPSGSVYLQMQVQSICFRLCAKIQSRDSVRYDYNHSVLKAGHFHGCEIKAGQRVSIMIRVSLAFFIDTVHDISSRPGPKGNTYI